MQLGNSGSYFHGCSNLELTATDAPNMMGTTTLDRVFRGYSNFGTSGNMNHIMISIEICFSDG